MDYQKEVQNGYLPKEDAIKLARPRTLSLTQQLMDWHHRLYHLPSEECLCLRNKDSYQRQYFNARIMLQSVLLVNLEPLIEDHGASKVNKVEV
eukprot:scaffold362192_cov291-Cyclotella_meneghiniana.AAC.1